MHVVQIFIFIWHILDSIHGCKIMIQIYVVSVATESSETSTASLQVTLKNEVWAIKMEKLHVIQKIRYISKLPRTTSLQQGQLDNDAIAILL